MTRRSSALGFSSTVCSVTIERQGASGRAARECRHPRRRRRCRIRAGARSPARRSPRSPAPRRHRTRGRSAGSSRSPPAGTRSDPGDRPSPRRRRSDPGKRARSAWNTSVVYVAMPHFRGRKLPISAMCSIPDRVDVLVILAHAPGHVGARATCSMLNSNDPFWLQLCCNAPRPNDLDPRSAAPAVCGHPLIRQPQVGRGCAGLPEDVDRDAAARIPIAADPQPARLPSPRQPLADADRAVLVERGVVAEAAEEQLERLRSRRSSRPAHSRSRGARNRAAPSPGTAR